MNKLILTGIILMGCLSASAQSKQAKKIGDFIESTSYNDAKRGAERTLQYVPEGDDFVSVNGKNRFTRALYGSWSAFRRNIIDSHHSNCPAGRKGVWRSPVYWQ